METVPAAASRSAGRDRLSDLPDCLLHRVLSSLRSRQAMQTCLLSRRWRHLWRSVPCIDVDQRDFLLDEPRPEAPAHDASNADRRAYNKALEERLDREIKRRCRFEDFADAVLLLHGASPSLPLDACRLHVADRDLRRDLHRWIRRGLARHPAELRIAYSYERCRYRHDDDDLLFSFDFTSAALPVTSRLRRLHLSGLILSKKFADQLRSEFPVLEELELVNCEFYRFGRRIACRSLKRLRIEGRYGSYNSLRGEYCFLRSLRNATVVELRSFTTTGLLEEEPDEFREFHKLRTLILRECEIGDRCQVLRHVLQKVPNLETLVLQDCKISGRCSGESASRSSCRGSAFHGCKNLRSIQVKYEDHDAPHVLVAVLAEIAKDVVKTQGGKINSLGWLDWMRRVVSCSHKTSHSQSVVIAEPDTSLSDDEHECSVRKHRAGKKHVRDNAIKARHRAARLARG